MCFPFLRFGFGRCGPSYSESTSVEYAVLGTQRAKEVHNTALLSCYCLFERHGQNAELLTMMNLAASFEAA
jgi:hypothetical protein